MSLQMYTTINQVQRGCYGVYFQLVNKAVIFHIGIVIKSLDSISTSRLQLRYQHS